METKQAEAKSWFGIGAALLGGFALHKWVLPYFDPPHREIEDDDNSDDLHAEVSNPNGTMLFTKTAQSAEPLIGHGREALDKKLEYGYYVGKLTGLSFEELAQVTTAVDDKTYTFWVKKDDISTKTRKQLEEGESIFTKPQAILQDLVNSLIA
jgi:hypothetical protein